jgi:hypothetical protein
MLTHETDDTMHLLTDEAIAELVEALIRFVVKDSRVAERVFNKVQSVPVGES